MTNNQKPQYVKEYLAGIDPAKRKHHRGVLRMFENHPQYSLDDVSSFVELKKRKYSGTDLPLTAPPIHTLAYDGFYYFYADEFNSTVESLQEAAVILKRNRSTLNSYTKNPTFPAIRTSDGGWSVDIVATQDWILWNTNHHADLTPYWPELENNYLITMHKDQAHEKEPTFELHSHT